jgi:hypothetical protein
MKKPHINSHKKKNIQKAHMKPARQRKIDYEEDIEGSLNSCSISKLISALSQQKLQEELILKRGQYNKFAKNIWMMKKMLCLLKIPTKNGPAKYPNEEHVAFIIQNTDGNHLTSINDILESFCAQFEGFSIKKSAIYSYMREEYQFRSSESAQSLNEEILSMSLRSVKIGY